MADGLLFVAVGCGRVAGMFDIAGKRPFVVFATMDGEALAGLFASFGDTASDVVVYFYESG